ncbi:MAG TPA: zf-HC2 domain-containing protein [Bryobacteraceae bacterium]|nr:zf-HC2 domain-containing protein [Bryobacteraceae bacterium]
MSCLTNPDLKAYVVGELSRRERAAVEEHVRGCQGCREELDRLNMTRAALASLEDEEIPRRIAFVSDRVFEPRWWQTMWHSGPVMGFASAALLAAAILVHGFEQPAAPTAKAPVVDTAAIEQQVEARVNAKLDAAVAKAVSDSQAKQSAEFAKVLNATSTRFERQRREDLATMQQAGDYYQRQLGRLVVASNLDYKQ